MGRLFGTDGVRGVANSQLTPQMAYKLGKAGAAVLGRQKHGSPLIIIGRDTRISGDMLENALAAGVMSAGGNVIKAGVIPTPAIAFLVGEYGADAGAVISASHNPFEYNGIKFFNGQGFKLSDAIEDEIESLILNDNEEAFASAEQIGTVSCREAESKELYISHVAKTADGDFKALKVVMDCANGASYITAPEVYRQLGAELTVIADSPDGININDGYGSTHPEKLQQAVIDAGADIGLAYDGDADRLIVVDEKGRIVDGDKVICICAAMLKSKGMLRGDLVTGTVMSNLGFHKHLEAMGCKTVSTRVGDRYVLESMLETGGVIGGEQSGHIIFLDYATTGDGTLASVQFINAVKHSGRKVSELADEITLYPQVLVNAGVKNENKAIYMKDKQIADAISALENKMAGEGRVLIRPSGTEPLVRVMIEGTDREQIAQDAKELAQLIESKFA